MKMITTHSAEEKLIPLIGEGKKLQTKMLPLIRFFVFLLALAGGLAPLSSTAQTGEESRLPISLDADYSGYDGKAGVLTFKGLRLTQGAIGIEADEGKASKLDFADSTWQFSGNVVIDIDNTHIECDGADLQFRDHELKMAIISGSPATFFTRRGSDNNITEGKAGQLKYDFEKGLVEFSDHASITESGNLISSNYLVYNINDQLINAQATSDGDDKVKITFTPPKTESGNGGDTSLEPEETTTIPESGSSIEPQNELPVANESDDQ